MAISSQIENRLDFEPTVSHWEESGLLKPSIFKSAIATIEKEYVLAKLGHLSQEDIDSLDDMLSVIC